VVKKNARKAGYAQHKSEWRAIRKYFVIVRKQIMATELHVPNLFRNIAVYEAHVDQY
jgi:hypothetical protein